MNNTQHHNSKPVVSPRYTGNIGHKTERRAQDILATLDTRQNEEKHNNPRYTGNIGHKTE